MPKPAREPISFNSPTSSVHEAQRAERRTNQKPPWVAMWTPSLTCIPSPICVPVQWLWVWLVTDFATAEFMSMCSAMALAHFGARAAIAGIDLVPGPDADAGVCRIVAGLAASMIASRQANFYVGVAVALAVGLEGVWRSAAPVILKISLFHEEDLITQWACHSKTTTLAEIQQHIPSRFERGTYVIMFGDRALEDLVCFNKPTVTLRLVPTAKRIDVVLRLISGAEVMSWRQIPPHLRLSDLHIPGAWGSFLIMKGEAIMDLRERVWKEGGPERVELTMVKHPMTYTIFVLYLSVSKWDYRAYRFPEGPVNVMATAGLTAQDCLDALYAYLQTFADTTALRFMALLQADITDTHVLNQSLRPRAFVGGDKRTPGGVEAIVSLNDDRRFELSFCMNKRVLVNALKGHEIELVVKTIAAVSEERTMPAVAR